jgi:murein DD-endopeptidase MepM/ murein hydrolase activator NlpD
LRGRSLLTGFKFARAAYVMFAVAVLLALLKLGGLGAHPLFLRIVPTESVAKAAEPVAGGRASEGEVLDLPDADDSTSGSVGRLLTLASRVSNLPGREESARTGEPSRDDAPVFHRPSSGKTRGTDGEPVCGNLGDFPKSSRAVFPLSSDYFDSYEDTWGAARPQGGHEGTDLMSPTGTPEFAITDGTIVPVKGANENGWNRLGGYTVMLEAAYDAGPIKKGDLFYYAHMDDESALKLGTKVRAGQQIGVVGDTGEGREVTRGKFPPHLHFGWYDTGSASSRTNLESGAMDPYPLLLWLEANGGAVTGGTDASYCEAQQEESVPDSTSTSSDLDTGDRNDARPSPAVEESRQDHPQEPQSKPDEEKKSDKVSRQTDTQRKDEVSASESDKQDEAESVSNEALTPNASPPTPLLSDSRSDRVPQPAFAEDPAKVDGDQQDTEPPVESKARKPPDLPKDKEPKDRIQPTCDPSEKADEGNLVRITRHQAPITREEWLALLKADPDMRVCKAGRSVQTLKDLAIWTGHPGHDEVRFYLRGGEIVVKNPDGPTIRKIRKIADALGARVRYDDGEKD